MSVHRGRSCRSAEGSSNEKSAHRLRHGAHLSRRSDDGAVPRRRLAHRTLDNRAGAGLARLIVRGNRAGPLALCRSAAALTLLLAACGSDDGNGAPPAPVAVLSAFPAELAPLLERAEIDETIVAGGRTFRLGRIGPTRVVLALTGIGLVNATATTQTLLDGFEVSGVVFSGVAGSDLRIGDVAVPETWQLVDGPPLAVDAGWLTVAGEVAAASIALETCTLARIGTREEPVCLAHAPEVVVGGAGRSDDDFGDMPFRCQPLGDDVFGCDVAPARALDGRGSEIPAAGAALAHRTAELAFDQATRAVDMETAAVAREVAARGLPFIAFRAVSDGEGDPLGLPGFPYQFFAYYRLAARNAAAATIAFLERLAHGSPAM
jgi:nucleoside phosphorylase